MIDAILDWAGVERDASLAILIFGFAAQGIFFARWLVQWFAAERAGRSHIPVAFWWLSLTGATLLFTYFLMRHEPVGMLGQSVGWVVYARNLRLVKKGSEREEG